MKPEKVLIARQADKILELAIEYANLQYDHGCDVMGSGFLPPDDDEQRLIERRMAFDELTSYLDSLAGR